MKSTLILLYFRTLANDVDEDQYKDFYYKHHGGAVSFNGGRGEGSQQYYMAIEVRIHFYYSFNSRRPSPICEGAERCGSTWIFFTYLREVLR